MPIYKYRCTTPHGNTDDGYTVECGHEYEELFTTFSSVEDEENELKCPECGGIYKERVLNTNGVSHQLKGKGWYRDGY